MNLAPSETEKLLMAVAGMVARDRLARGVKLNYPESVALLSTWVIERAREGGRVEDLMITGREVLTRDRGDGRGRRDAHRRPGRGDLPRRAQARHPAPADPVSGGEPDERDEHVSGPGCDQGRSRASWSSTPIADRTSAAS